MTNALLGKKLTTVILLQALLALSSCGLKAHDEETCSKDSDCESNLRCVGFGNTHYCSLECSTTIDCTGLGTDYICYTPLYPDVLTPQICALKCRDSFGQCYNNDKWSCQQEPSSTGTYACYPN